MHINYRRKTSVFIESLEARQMMVIYTAEDYFPLEANQHSTYSSTLNGDSATATRTSKLSRIGDQSVVRLQDRLEKSDATTVLSHHYRHDGRGGLRDYLLDLDQANQFSATVTYSTAIRVLPRTFEIGTVGTWSGQKVTTTFRIPKIDDAFYGLTGTETGSSTVLPAENEIHGGFIFYNVLNLKTLRKQTFASTIGNQLYKITFEISESLNLAKGVGMISGDRSISIRIKSGKDVNFAGSLSEQSQLTTSSVLGAFTRVDGSTLRVSGTPENDDIVTKLEGNEILVIRNDIGVKAALASSITRIAIDAAAGNDSIHTLELGKMKSMLMGGDGNDFIGGGPGRDLIFGGEGNDIIIANAGIDTIFGGSGNDMINGNGGADFIDAGDGIDTVRRDDLDTRIAVEVLVG